MRLFALLAVAVLASCGQASHATPIGSPPIPSPTLFASPSPTLSPAPSATVATPPPSASPAESPVAQVPSVQCVAGAIPGSMAMVVGFAGTFLYDVDDPLHPRVVCRISNTSAHILTGTSLEYLEPKPNGTTNVVVHSLGSNNEGVAATFATGLADANLGSPFGSVSWPIVPTVLGYMAAGANDSLGLATNDVWVVGAGRPTKLYNYSVPGVDSFSRPGLPPFVLAISPDGAYMVAGWAFRSTLHVFRLSDGADVSPAMPAGVRSAVWSRTGHALYIIGSSGVEAWTPEAGASAVRGTIAWTLQPSFSPNDSQVVFTAITSSGIRSLVYGFNSGIRILIDQPRSEAMFVKADWVWYIEEKPCVQADSHVCFDPTEPDGNVLAMNLATGQESPVTFAAGESPVRADFVYMVPGDVWPLG